MAPHTAVWAALKDKNPVVVIIAIVVMTALGVVAGARIFSTSTIETVISTRDDCESTCTERIERLTSEFHRELEALDKRLDRCEGRYERILEQIGSYLPPIDLPTESLMRLVSAE
jgi:hypothetical protein